MTLTFFNNVTGDDVIKLLKLNYSINVKKKTLIYIKIVQTFKKY